MLAAGEKLDQVRVQLNRWVKDGSYVSLQSALSYHGMIPEYVPETTCITTGRPLCIQTPFGRISYRHLKSGAFTGFVAAPGTEIIHQGRSRLKPACPCGV
jgi:hypothetical protein